MRLSRFNSERDNTPQAWDTDWPGLCLELGKFRDGKKSGPAWSPAAYPPGVSRANDSVETVSCLVLDFDSGERWDGFLADWTARGLAFAWHTTARHAPDAPRWRAVLPLAVPVPAAEWPAVCRSLTAALGHGAAEIHDDAARLYYLPTLAEGAQSGSRDGRPVSLADAPTEQPAPSLRPGDDFNARTGWVDLLEPAGWTRLDRLWRGQTLWVRPGKNARDGHSARTGETEHGDRFYCWSSEAGVPSGRLLTKFGLYTELHHGGDFAAAAASLARQGYGTGPVPGQCAPSELPQIQANSRQARDVVDAAIAALRSANDPPRWFLRGGVVSEAQWTEGGVALRPLTAEAMTDRLSRCADWVSVTQKFGTQDVVPPKYVAGAVLSLGTATGLPTLDSVSQCPFATADGRIVASPGYDPGSLTYADLPRAVVPSGSAKDAARWLIDELLADFPFQGHADLAAALACMLTPFVRPCIAGQSPLFLFDAPSPATGKTLCAQVALAPGCGAVGVKAPPSREEEWTKLLTTYALAARPAMLVDNVSGRFDSPSLMAAVTSGVVEDRKLGGNDLLVLPVRTIFAATANNARLAPDFVSRCLWIRLDAGAERPEERTGFKKPKLLAWATEHRAECQERCLAMVAQWHRAGRPAGTVPPTRFAAWAETLGGVLEHAGIDGLLSNIEELRAANDDERIVRAGALADLLECSNGDEFLIADIWDKAIDHPGFQAFVALFDGAQNLKRAVGNALSSMVGQVFGDTSLVRGGRAKGGRRFKVVTPMTLSSNMESTRGENLESFYIGGVSKMAKGGVGATLQVQTGCDTSKKVSPEGDHGVETW